MSEAELILEKLKIVSEEKENGMYLCDKEHSKILLNYIQQKENVIKEAREYIESYNLPKDLGHLGEAPISIRELRDILEILDKENK